MTKRRTFLGGLLAMMLPWRKKQERAPDIDDLEDDDMWPGLDCGFVIECDECENMSCVGLRKADGSWELWIRPHVLEQSRFAASQMAYCAKLPTPSLREKLRDAGIQTEFSTDARRHALVGRLPSGITKDNVLSCLQKVQFGPGDYIPDSFGVECTPGNV